MIVNLTKAGWQIIYQQAHALLAMQLAWHWQPFGPADRWVSLLAAIAQHDDEQKAWDGHYGLTPAGAPADFTLQEFSLEQAQGVVRAARFQGRWRSLLTSMHLSVLYEPLRGQQKATDAFLDEQLASQETWRKQLKVSKKEAQQAYDLMHWCDRLSLILCRQELPEMGRSLEIYTGSDGQRYDVVRPTADGPITITPWPFQAKSFTVSVETSLLTQLQFKDDPELAAALRTAPIETLSWGIVK
ncbi:Protein of unknown function [Hymenobacter daecheongensis DSM 21074]|uniref:DUF3891 domain-containing protein n=1 Tax=Hymenobacter daecheongensis DSM 21074 TaxID=1121955 RepID=A0A1M6IYE1_9BACT|nr:DUF3891 family protein [Hymenobacter daecheongensis]SHJ39461.1 Protein of unknown function [Hymenobacter daecheongensis DSM 21074]